MVAQHHQHRFTLRKVARTPHGMPKAVGLRLHNQGDAGVEPLQRLIRRVQLRPALKGSTIPRRIARQKLAVDRFLFG
jgi:hypothetical protein